ncbi:UBX domain-containing protein 6 [Strongylocentrotus purpuratus]|uniref:UBX domain-containing protein n=1 Tax=Strongylocentrotus purpuratus TaxID=7668 RepID=A0A7M7G9Z2_STRPU|nr:UBX domain-containing protein 6 [Strongylocentrotus purpuratus]|eukprot:XP_001198732.1 PREDICTED: UBX domain-containing protein 6 [Strongylocentrotus purpuratus]
MKKIGAFFEKKKTDMKFKQAGHGVKLNESTPQSSTSGQPRPVAPRLEPSCSSQMAGQAALTRLDPGPGACRPRSAASASIKAQVQLDNEAKQKQLSSQAQGGATANQDYSDNQAALLVLGVTFRCRCSMRLKKPEFEAHLTECLLMQLAEDPPSASATMVYTLNKDKGKIKVGVDTICKYLDNVCLNPGEEKYRKIRSSNKAFQERITGLVGAEEFLQAVGFERKILPYEDSETDFFVLNEERASDIDRLNAMKELLKSGTPYKPVLERDMKVYQPSQRASHFELPSEFYMLTPEEIKKEQQIRAEVIERGSVLRTKAMKEAESQKALRRYRYALIRVRFPDGVLLQGTFYARDKLRTLKEFVQSQLDNSWQPFILTDPGNIKLTDDDKMLAELHLAPAVVINFSWDAEVMADIAAANQGAMRVTYLKPDAMGQLQPL